MSEWTKQRLEEMIADDLENEVAKEELSRSGDDKHRLFKRFKTRSAPEYFAIRVK
jgi:hypothetical protein